MIGITIEVGEYKLFISCSLSKLVEVMNLFKSEFPELSKSDVTIEDFINKHCSK